MLIYVPTTPKDSIVENKLLQSLGLKNKHDKIHWPLPNLKQVEEKDYWSHAMTWTPEADVYVGQIKVDDKWFTLRLCYVNHGRYIDGGFAVLYSHEWRKEEVRYYTWAACDHDFESRTVGRCLTSYTCKHCSKSYEVDSSG